MTLPELITLSKTPDGPERIRVMVAEMAGWELWNDGAETLLWKPACEGDVPHRVFSRGDGRPDKPIVCFTCPPYTTSLDAVMPLVRALPVHQLTSYSINRAKIAAVDWTGHDDQSQYPNCGYYTSMKMLTSTALDICIALLATLKP
jgi:hypothetical protein